MTPSGGEAKYLSDHPRSIWYSLSLHEKSYCERECRKKKDCGENVERKIIERENVVRESDVEKMLLEKFVISEDGFREVCFREICR